MSASTNRQPTRRRCRRRLPDRCYCRLSDRYCRCLSDQCRRWDSNDRRDPKTPFRVENRPTRGYYRLQVNRQQSILAGRQKRNRTDRTPSDRLPDRSTRPLWPPHVRGPPDRHRTRRGPRAAIRVPATRSSIRSSFFSMNLFASCASTRYCVSVTSQLMYSTSHGTLYFCEVSSSLLTNFALAVLPVPVFP